MVRLVEGRVVADDDGDSGGFLTRVLRCRGDTTINLLGFRLPFYWSIVMAVFAALRFGVPGLVFLGIVASASHYGCNDEGGGGSGSRRILFSRRSNIRGMEDLPRPPPSS
eukprot:g15122.t1